jgi:hypothetical protein
MHKIGSREQGSRGAGEDKGDKGDKEEKNFRLLYGRRFLFGGGSDGEFTSPY